MTVVDICPFGTPFAALTSYQGQKGRGQRRVMHTFPLTFLMAKSISSSHRSGNLEVLSETWP